MVLDLSFVNLQTPGVYILSANASIMLLGLEGKFLLAPPPSPLLNRECHRSHSLYRTLVRFGLFEVVFDFMALEMRLRTAPGYLLDVSIIKSLKSTLLNLLWGLMLFAHYMLTSQDQRNLAKAAT